MYTATAHGWEKERFLKSIWEEGKGFQGQKTLVFWLKPRYQAMAGTRTPFKRILDIAQWLRLSGVKKEGVFRGEETTGDWGGSSMPKKSRFC